MKLCDLEFKPHPVSGLIAKVAFENGYGASVVSGPLFYTDEGHPYEVAVWTSRMWTLRHTCRRRALERAIRTDVAERTITGAGSN